MKEGIKVKRHPAIVGIFGSLAILALTLVVMKFIFLPPGPNVICHKQIDGAFMAWMKVNGNTKAYPNIEGSSSKSLLAIWPFFRGPDEKMSDVLGDYVYIPGLRTDDTNSLVLLYVRKKTRQTWHGDLPTIFRKQKWIVIELNPSSEVVGELNEWISANELRAKITNTLAFLRTNDRPNWQAIVAEQTKFLEVVHE